MEIEQIKPYFWYFFGIIGVVFFWTGVWDGIGYLGPLKNPWISLAIGLIMLSLSGIIFREANPFQNSTKKIESVARKIHKHPEKRDFHIKYHDRIQHKEIPLCANRLRKIENGFLVFLDKADKEIFVPFHRVTEVMHKGKTHWKA